LDVIAALGWIVVGALISLLFTAVFQNPLDRLVGRTMRRIGDSAPIRRLSSASARERRHRDILSQDFEDLGVFTLLRWSVERPLRRDPRLHRLEYGSAPEQDWFDPSALRSAQLKQAELRKENTAYAFGMTVDHHEHEEADSFILRVAASRYGDLNAIGECMAGSDLTAFVRNRLHERGSIEFLRSMPPTRLSIQVSILTGQGRILALRRSYAVASVPGLWSLGPNETLVPPPDRATPGMGSESLFDLAERCLLEECGLFYASSPPEIGPIHITWFGVSVRPGEGVAQNVIALTTSSLPESEIAVRISNAHSNYEALSAAWLPFSLNAMVEVVTSE
jgi:hypothetical protein